MKLRKDWHLAGKTQKLYYTDFVSQLNRICQSKSHSDFPRLILVKGSSDYLMTRSAEAIRKTWLRIFAGESESLSDDQITQEELRDRLDSQGLFSTDSLLILNHCERLKWLAGSETHWEAFRTSSTFLVLLYHSDKIDAKFLAASQKASFHVVPCVEPSQQELPRFVRALAKKYNLSLTASAINLLIKALGNELSLLDNEVAKLALIFHEETCEISDQDINPYLTMLREDHAFTLDDLLTSRNYADAQLLITDLLRRGQSALAILGILARHCRNALKIRAVSREAPSPVEAAKAVRLPVFVVRRYLNYVTKIPSRSLKNALTHCQSADLSLKSSPISDELLLGEILDCLSAT